MGTLLLKTLATLLIHLRVSRYTECVQQQLTHVGMNRRLKCSLWGPYVANCVLLSVGLRMFF